MSWPPSLRVVTLWSSAKGRPYAHRLIFAVVALRRRNSATAERPSVTPLALEKLAIEHFRGTEVIARVAEVQRDLFGNPGAAHPCGQRAARAIERVRGQVATHLGCFPERVVFTR